jgi:hypothetical protein
MPPGEAGPPDGEAEPFTPSIVAQMLMDVATVEVREHSQWSDTIVVSLPSGEMARTTYTLDPTHVEMRGLPATSTPLVAFTRSTEVTEPGLRWHLDYVIPVASFPPDALVQAPPGQRPGWLDHVARLLTNPRTVSASEGAGVRVVAEGVVDNLRGELETAVFGDTLTDLNDAIGNLAKAIETSNSHRQMMRRIAQLRRCVQEPTNPLMQQQYRDDPSRQQSDLNDIRETEIAIMSDTAVRFVNVMTSQAAGLVPWLGHVVGPATAWAEAEALRYSRDRLRRLERQLSACEDAKQWMGTITYTKTSTNVLDRSYSSTCCGGQPTTDTRREEEDIKLVQQWVIGETFRGNENGALLAVQFMATYSSIRTISAHSTGWASCRGEPRGGTIPTWHTETGTKTGQGVLSAPRQIRVERYEGGLLVASAAPPLTLEAPVESTTTKEHGGGACLRSRPTETQSYSSQVRALVGGLSQRWPTDPKNPDVVTGADTVIQQIGDWTHIHQWTWDLERR